jgi:hypothetical protein
MVFNKKLRFKIKLLIMIKDISKFNICKNCLTKKLKMNKNKINLKMRKKELTYKSKAMILMSCKIFNR